MEQCGITPHRLYCDSLDPLTLKATFYEVK